MTTTTMPDLPGQLTLDQVHAVLRSFGYRLTIAPLDVPVPPIGFAADRSN